MGMLLDQGLPPDLLPWKENIEATVKPYIAITARLENNLQPWQSKFAGLPYLPNHAHYPLDLQRRPLFLLAQINFAETPKLEGFPEQGMLQFYISGDTYSYGANLDDLTAQEGFRVIYFPDVITEPNGLTTDFSFLPEPRMLPLQKPCSLKFNLRDAPISAVDYRFERAILGRDVLRFELGEEFVALCGQYERLFPSSGHKIGGYPYFTQSDPRQGQKYRDEDYVLLFQMDSDGDADILWGDVGVGNFFVREQDLKERDFSSVLYSWDCA
jgi:uncharacterized protein YwqG